MRKFWRQSVPLIVVQTVCLAVGLWMQHHHLVKALRQTLEQETRNDLQRAVDEIVRQTSSAPMALREPAGHSELRAAFARFAPPGAAVAIVDSTWKVLAWLSPPLDLPAEKDGQTLRWIASPEPGQESGASQGFVDFENQTRLAFHRQASERLGVVAFAGAARIEQTTVAHARSLAVAGGITLLWTVAVLSIAALVILGRSQERIEARHARASAEMVRQAHSLVRTRDAVIFGLAKLAESRDEHTGEHLDRISAYATALATALARDPRFAPQVDLAFVRLIGSCAALHDIGKVGVADGVLRKPGALTPSERAQMEAHALIGGRCLQEIEHRLGGSNFLQMAREIALAHHERWDGQGYPCGLGGAEIPLAARIVSLADVYDALSSRRVYKEALPHEDCVRIIRAEAGTQFDPAIVEVWLTIESQFREIAGHFRARSPAGDGPRFVPDQKPLVNRTLAGPTVPAANSNETHTEPPVSADA